VSLPRSIVVVTTAGNTMSSYGVFSERLASPAMAQALARDTGVGTAVLDPIEGPGDGPGDGSSDGAGDGSGGADYVALMEENLSALQEAGAC